MQLAIVASVDECCKLWLQRNTFNLSTVKSHWYAPSLLIIASTAGDRLPALLVTTPDGANPTGAAPTAATEAAAAGSAAGSGSAAAAPPSPLPAAAAAASSTTDWLISSPSSSTNTHTGTPTLIPDVPSPTSCDDVTTSIANARCQHE